MMSNFEVSLSWHIITTLFIAFVLLLKWFFALSEIDFKAFEWNTNDIWAKTEKLKDNFQKWHCLDWFIYEEIYRILIISIYPSYTDIDLTSADEIHCSPHAAREFASLSINKIQQLAYNPHIFGRYRQLPWLLHKLFVTDFTFGISG